MSPLRPNPNLSGLVCSATGTQHDLGGFARPLGLCRCCPSPGRPLELRYDLEAVRPLLQDGADRPRGLWRFAPLLPVLDPPPGFAEDVGETPVVPLPALGDAHGVELLAKHEGLNPSGSFKDRGLAMGIALGVACGAKRFCLPTQGNAGVAASLFSARLGLPGALVYMPDGYQGGIYHRQAELFGAEVRFFGGNIAAAGRRMREDCADGLASGELVDMSTFFEPGRLEGKKTMGLELVEQLGPGALPEVILYPTGGGTGLVGIWKALSELECLGVVDHRRHRLPRLVAVQSANCAPVVRAFERGLEQVEPVTSEGTVAEGLDVPGAIMGHGILRAIRASGGSAVAPTEDEIRGAFSAAGAAGLGAGYETAALLAALARLRAEGGIAEGARVLLLATSSHLIALGQGTTLA